MDSRAVAVKICGVNSADAFDAVLESRADYVGFVFFPWSPRCVTPSEAAALSARGPRGPGGPAGPGGPKRVGLFVAPDDGEIAAALERVDLDALQIYADRARCAQIRARFGRPVWRAVGAATAADLPRDAEGLDGFVVEPPPPPGADRPGGNAVSFDATLLHGWPRPAFWLLAGGLNAATVAAAIVAARPSGVDVSSGVESAPGVKVPALIREFVARVRATR